MRTIKVVTRWRYKLENRRWGEDNENEEKRNEGENMMMEKTSMKAQGNTKINDNKNMTKRRKKINDNDSN